ncbi:N-acetyldiaminopimelate deacetylase [Brevibacillus laterosporus]|uniref:N-acetyldiaminopimelate deacetylase n=1 Tax=Brevibacillus halotolerans TaxID=1507437 RepID=A0ABT4HS84_9BACL|nr:MULTISPECIES: N-acetyldiaminopimelate deacetylase [Brevibacillus]MCR8983946.1 N-acetyldiaminopimelate deacetylase [Brevibacillus laterosporus]MCZ0829665.1 N-acetyldiaminopimelate deacetylase [Brevibacillus halotolerans]
MTSPFVAIRRELHKIPEPGFAEFKTQQFLLSFIAQLPQEHLEVTTWKTGVLVKVNGTSPKRMLAWRADMDGLPIEEETSYDFRSQHQGYMHACGHDLHMAIGLGILSEFAKSPAVDDLLFVFQPAEEGPGGAEPMLASPEFRCYKPDAIFALHIAPEYQVGTIAMKEGVFFANTSELFIEVKGKGGHAAYPHLANDMVVVAAQLVTQLQTIVARNVNPLDAGVITVGKIEGGTKQNIIAEVARLEGTIRTLSQDSMRKIKQRIEAIVQGIETGFDCEATIDYGAMYCQVYNDPELSKRFMNWLDLQDDVTLVRCTEAMTGEDFGYFLAEIPGFLFWLGVDTSYGLHHAKLEPNEQAIENAIEIITRFFRQYEKIMSNENN